MLALLSRLAAGPRFGALEGGALGAGVEIEAMWPRGLLGVERPIPLQPFPTVEVTDPP